MSYYKVYYDDLESFQEASYKQCDKWVQTLEGCRDSIKEFRKSDSFKGSTKKSGAYKIKNYYKEVHLTLIDYLIQISQGYKAKIGSYVADYYTLDTGDGSKHGRRYTTMVSEELKKGGKIDKKLTKTKTQAQEIRKDIARIHREIDSLVSERLPDPTGISSYLDDAIKRATNTDLMISAHIEKIHQHDFKDINPLIQSTRNLLNAYQERSMAMSYQPGEAFTHFDVQQTLICSQNCAADIEKFEKSDAGKLAAEIAYGRAARIHEEEKDSRQWANWVSTGAKVVGGVAIVVAAASGVGLVGVAVVGAVGGSISGATSCLTDQYIETGDALQDLDYFKLVKDTALGGITGAFSGYTIGVAATSSITLSTFDKVVTGVTEESLKSAVSFTIDGAEALYYGVESQFTKDKSKLEKVRDQFFKDVNDAPKEIIKKGATSFISGKLDDAYDNKLITESWSDSKSIVKKGLNKGGKKFVEKSSTQFANEAIDLASNAAQGKYTTIEKMSEDGKIQTTPDSQSKTPTFVEDLAEGYGRIVGKSVNAFGGGAFSSVGGAKIEKIKDSHTKSVVQMTDKIITSSSSKVGEAIMSREATNIVTKDHKHLSGEEIWKDSLDGGRVIFENGVDEIAKEVKIGRVQGYNKVVEEAQKERDAQKKK